MSNNAIDAVKFSSRSKGVARLVLLMIADGTSTTSECYNPLVHTKYGGLQPLAKNCACSVRTVQRQFYGPDGPDKPGGLVALGELVIEEHPGRSSRYYIPILQGEEGYAPAQCQEEHICNGYHTPLDRNREQIKRERARRLAEEQGKTYPRQQCQGSPPTTVSGVKSEAIDPRQQCQGPPTTVSGVPPTTVSGSPDNSVTPYPNIPISLPSMSHAASPPLEYEPEREQIAEPTYAEVNDWIKTLEGRAALLPHGERAKWAAVKQREVCIDWAARHPEKWQEWRANRFARMEQDREVDASEPAKEPGRAS